MAVILLGVPFITIIEILYPGLFHLSFSYIYINQFLYRGKKK